MPLLLLLTASLGCGESNDSGAAAPGPGTLSISFAIEEDLIPSMTDAPIGEFLGSIFAEDDATSIGPNEGAQSLEDVAVTIDLSDGEALDAYTSIPLEAGVFWILGCLDVDGNDCDIDDPITIPDENKFQVEADQQAPAEVLMSMLNPT